MGTAPFRRERIGGDVLACASSGWWELGQPHSVINGTNVGREEDFNRLDCLEVFVFSAPRRSLDVDRRIISDLRTYNLNRT